MKFTPKVLTLTLSTLAFSHAVIASKVEADKDFVWYCKSDNATEAQKRTVLAILTEKEIDLDKTTCQAAFNKIKDTPVIEINSWGLTDLAPLNGFSQIGTLDLSQNELESLDSLPKLPNLDDLDLSSNLLTKVPLHSIAPQIIYLNLSTNPITDFGAISSYKSLKSLMIDETGAEDFSFLAGLALTRLTVGQIKHPESLSTLPSISTLKDFSTYWTTIDSFDFIKKFENITSISFQECKLTDLSSLRPNHKLKSLLISGNSISEIPDQLLDSKVNSLDLDDNPIQSFEFLKSIDSMEYTFSASGTRFDNWNDIFHLRKSLKEVYLASTPLTTLDTDDGSEQSWPNLTNLDINSTKIKDLSFFKKFNAPRLYVFEGPTILNPTEENCPTTGVPKPVAEFCTKAQLKAARN